MTAPTGIKAAVSPTADVILAAARESVLDAGFAALSTRRVAERAGVPLSQIHYHFGSKENLILALFTAENARLLDRQAALYAGDESLADQWARACDYLDDDLNSGYVRILHELMAAGFSQPQFAAHVRDMLAGWTTVLTNAFAHHQTRGVDFGPLTIEQLAALTSAVFLGAESMILLGQDGNRVPIRGALRAIGQVIAAAERDSNSTAASSGGNGESR